jgi:hypothetical protein
VPYHYDPNQPRVPAGHSDGGQWSGGDPGKPTVTKPAVLGPRPREEFGRDDPIVPAAFSFPARPGAGPLIPPYAFPGTPENKEWTEHAIRALQGLLDFILLNSRNDARYERHEKELQRCKEAEWQVAHPDYIDACRKRALYRLRMCIANRGKPSPHEPREWEPGADGDEETWINPDR